MRRVYRVDSDRSQVVVRARSSVHDTTTTWSRITGTVEADLDALGDPGGVSVEVAVDMRRYDAGDFLRNRKLKGDLEVDEHPEARFSLGRVIRIERDSGGRFDATGEGVLSWRDREVTIQPAGTGTIDDSAIEAEATFELDVRDLGVKPPRFLMLKVEDVVSVEVTLRASVH